MTLDAILSYQRRFEAIVAAQADEPIDTLTKFIDMMSEKGMADIYTFAHAIDCALRPIMAQNKYEVSHLKRSNIAIPPKEELEKHRDVALAFATQVHQYADKIEANLKAKTVRYTPPGPPPQPNPKPQNTKPEKPGVSFMKQGWLK